MKRSRGYICIAGTCEYYLTRHGLFASLTSNEIDWNGYRKPASRVCHHNEIAAVLNLLGVTERGKF